jgi:hypothetical protein
MLIRTRLVSTLVDPCSAKYSTMASRVRVRVDIDLGYWRIDLLAGVI